jgi:CRISPR system Cascade subunit CasE
MVPVMGQRGKRIDLRTETEQIAWLERKLLDEAGSELLDFGFADEGWVVAGAGKQVIRHRAVLFDGVLRVAEPALVRTAIRQGVGRGRSYGLGMLSLAPARL